MKKILYTIILTGLFICGMAGLANATLIGNSVIDRPNLDSATNITMVDTSLQFTAGGTISEWLFYASRPGDIYLQIFRNLGGSLYQVVGETMVSSNVGFTAVALSGADKIAYQNDDFIGWTIGRQAIIPYSNGGNSVHWLANGQSVTGIGNTINLPNAGSRTYSIAVNSTPEPATMLLLGTGLAGIAGVARRRKKKLQ